MLNIALKGCQEGCSSQTCSVWRKSVAAASFQHTQRDGKRSTPHAHMLALAVAVRLYAGREVGRSREMTPSNGNTLGVT